MNIGDRLRELRQRSPKAFDMTAVALVAFLAGAIWWAVLFR